MARRDPGPTREELVPALMVQGVSSWAGKSLLTTALVRHFARRGVRVAPVQARFADLPAPWTALSHLAFPGYEIRHGRTRPVGAAAEAVDGGLGHVAGSVLGISVHGLLESGPALAALVGGAPADSLAAVFDSLADAAAMHLDAPALAELAGVG